MTAARRRTADGLNTVDIADRLCDVMAELSVVSDALSGSELDRLQINGLQRILHRQIDEIRAVENIIHPSNPETSCP